MGKPCKQIRPLPEIGGEHVCWITRDPLRQVDRLIGSGVESNQNATRLVAHIFDRMAVTLRNITDIALPQCLDPEATVRAKHGDGNLTVNDILPLIRVGVPMQLAQPAWIKIEDDSGDGRRDRETRRIHAPFAATLIDRMGCSWAGAGFQCVLCPFYQGFTVPPLPAKWAWVAGGNQ